MYHTLEEDFDQLENPGLFYQRRFAIIYRIEKKKIIRSNIDLCEYVLKILNHIKQHQENINIE